MKHIACILLSVIHGLLALSVAQEYVVPDPSFEVFSPKGFRVSIPDGEHLNLFAFHGNVNKPMDGLEAGQFSKDILKKKGDRWVFEDKKTKLEKGDVIYFWILVIRNNLGYRYDDGRFVVKDIVQKQPHNRSHASSSQPTTQSNSDDKTQSHNSMCDVTLTLLNTVDDLKGEVKFLRDLNDILKNIIAKDNVSSKILRFEGVLPPFDDPQYVAQIILEEKLGLRIPVVSAKWEKDKSITFEVTSLEDKIYLIRTAKEKLEKMRSKIILKY